MAQLKDTTVNGILEATSNMILNGKLYGIHPDTEEKSNMIYMGSTGNTIVGYGGYVNKNGNTYMYGEDVGIYSGAAGNQGYRPYYRMGDSFNVTIRTAGYCINDGRTVRFHIPLSKPIIGSPVVTATSNKGIILLQNGKYTHGSASDTYIYPELYETELRTGNIEITVSIKNTTNAISAAPIGIVWSGKITLS